MKLYQTSTNCFEDAQFIKRINYTGLTFIVILLMFFISNTMGQIQTFNFFVNSELHEGIGYAYEYPEGEYYFVGAKQIDTTSWKCGALIIKSDQFGDTSMHLLHLQDTSISISHFISTVNNMIGFGSYEAETKSIQRGLINLIFDLDLNLVSKRIFSFPSEYEMAMSTVDDILVDEDGYFIRILTIKEFESKQLNYVGDICFYKFDANGDTINTKILKLLNNQKVDAACFNADTSEIWVFGDGFSMSPKQRVKFDLNFNLISIDDFHYDAEYPLSIITESADTWLGCGTFNNFPNKSYADMWTFRMDSSGNILNDSILGTIDTNDYASFGRAITKDYEGNIYISGTHNVTIGFFPDVKSWISLTKMDADFNHVFTRYYNPDEKYYLNFDIKSCSDGGILLCNSRYDSHDNTTPPLNMDAWIIKVDNNGFLTDINEGSGNVKNALIYPNPGDNTINVICSWPNSTLKLYSSDGKLILSRELNHSITKVNTSSFASEIYFWTITQSGNKLIESGKWIKK